MDQLIKKAAMNLAVETIILAVGMLAVCAVPFIFQRTRSSSGMLFLFGTGALFSICVFDLIPDIVEMGGQTSLAVAIAVGLFYSLVHLIHIRRHQSGAHHGHNHDHDHHHHAHSLPIFFISIVSHCFASGILLAVSREFSEKLASAVFLALLGHKGYECIVFVSLLLNHRLSRAGYISAIAIYCLALPAGVLTSYLLAGHLSHGIAVFVSSIAVGSLLGCLVFDFMIPSLHQVKRHRLHAAWLLIGLVLTRIVMGFL